MKPETAVEITPEIERRPLQYWIAFKRMTDHDEFFGSASDLQDLKDWLREQGIKNPRIFFCGDPSPTQRLEAEFNMAAVKVASYVKIRHRDFADQESYAQAFGAIEDI